MKNYVVHPEADQDSEPYWQSLRDHEAKLQKCAKCGRFRFPPASNCCYCGALGGNWTAISGRGVIYSWIIIHHPVDPRLAAEVPFVIALVEIEEGPRLAGRLMGCRQEQIKTGTPVRIRYDDLDSEFTLANFEPAQ